MSVTSLQKVFDQIEFRADHSSESITMTDQEVDAIFDAVGAYYDNSEHAAFQKFFDYVMIRKNCYGCRRVYVPENRSAEFARLRGPAETVDRKLDNAAEMALISGVTGLGIGAVGGAIFGKNVMTTVGGGLVVGGLLAIAGALYGFQKD